MSQAVTRHQKARAFLSDLLIPKLGNEFIKFMTSRASLLQELGLK